MAFSLRVSQPEDNNRKPTIPLSDSQVKLSTIFQIREKIRFFRILEAQSSIPPEFSWESGYSEVINTSNMTVTQELIENPDL